MAVRTIGVAIAGFIAGVLMNIGIDTAGIALSGDFTWDLTRVQWFRVLLPYATASITVVFYLALKTGQPTAGYKTIGSILTLGLVVGVAVQLGSAYNQQTDQPEAAILTTAATTATTGPPPATLDTSFLLNGPDDPGTDGEYPIARLVHDYYWIEEWRPLWERVRTTNEAGDEEGMKVLCELARDDNAEVSQRIHNWDNVPSLLPHLSAMFDEMEIALAACAAGAWEQTNNSLDIVWDIFSQEVCVRLPLCAIAPSDGD